VRTFISNDLCHAASQNGIARLNDLKRFRPGIIRTSQNLTLLRGIVWSGWRINWVKNDSVVILYDRKYWFTR